MSIQPASRARTLPMRRCCTALDGLERRAVRDVGADRRRRRDAEEEDEDGRHERPAAHARHPDEQAREEPDDGELPVHAASSGSYCPVRVDQHLRDLGPRELDRRHLALAEHLAHLRPRQEHAVVRPVRARLRARHRPADVAPERVLEEHRLDVELVRRELVEDELRVVRAVVVADAGVVAADDEVRAAVVLAADRVPDRLARARVAHRRRERREQDAVRRVVAVEQRAVAVDAHVHGHVVRLRVADERMHEQPVHGLERDLRQVLVRAVDRVARLESDDALPAALGEDATRLGRVARELGERGRRAARRRSRVPRGRAASARTAARRRGARRRSCGSSSRPRAPCRTRTSPRPRARRPACPPRRRARRGRPSAPSRPRGRREAPTEARSRGACPRRRARSRPCP